MINFNNTSIYVSKMPRQECVINTMRENSKDTYVFCAPETLE